MKQRLTSGWDKSDNRSQRSFIVGLFKRVLWFLGGKPPEIIFDKGEVSHKLSEQKWKDWEARFEKNPAYDWRKHVATHWDKRSQAKK
jgi:hypothetical protein